MSECVVRMEMPKSCYNCDLRYECNAFYAPGQPKPFMKGCRIVCQLPKGHGRLVDEKSVRWAIDDIVLDIANRTGRVGMTKDETMEYINNLCTIVPAERSET